MNILIANARERISSERLNYDSTGNPNNADMPLHGIVSVDQIRPKSHDDLSARIENAASSASWFEAIAIVVDHRDENYQVILDTVQRIKNKKPLVGVFASETAKRDFINVSGGVENGHRALELGGRDCTRFSSDLIGESCKAAFRNYARFEGSPFAIPFGPSFNELGGKGDEESWSIDRMARQVLFPTQSTLDWQTGKMTLQEYVVKDDVQSSLDLNTYEFRILEFLALYYGEHVSRAACIYYALGTDMDPNLTSGVHAEALSINMTDMRVKFAFALESLQGKLRDKGDLKITVVPGVGRGKTLMQLSEASAQAVDVAPQPARVFFEPLVA